METAVQEILRKCEQYWNGPAVGAPELHAILEFIHTRAEKLVDQYDAGVEDGYQRAYDDFHTPDFRPD